MEAAGDGPRGSSGQRRYQRAAADRGADRLPGRRGGQSLLPFSFAFAAGAMLALVVVEVLPEALGGGRFGALAGGAIGAAAMLALSAVLGV